MAAKGTDAGKPEGRSFDEAYGFSFSIALGLLLFIAGLIISLTLGQQSSFGLFFGVPLLIAGVVVPLFMMRGVFAREEIIAPCPACGAEIKTTDATMQLDCAQCEKTLSIRDGGVYLRDEG